MSKEAFDAWRSSVQPHGYTSGHPWWFDTGLQKAFNAGSQSRQPEIERLRKDEADLIHDNSNLYSSLQGEMNARLEAEEEIERLRGEINDARTIVKELSVLIRNYLHISKKDTIWDMVKEYERKYINKKPAEAG